MDSKQPEGLKPNLKQEKTKPEPGSKEYLEQVRSKFHIGHGGYEQYLAQNPELQSAFQEKEQINKDLEDVRRTTRGRLNDLKNISQPLIEDNSELKDSFQILQSYYSAQTGKRPLDADERTALKQASEEALNHIREQCQNLSEPLQENYRNMEDVLQQLNTGCETLEEKRLQLRQLDLSLKDKDPKAFESFKGLYKAHTGIGGPQTIKAVEYKTMEKKINQENDSKIVNQAKTDTVSSNSQEIQDLQKIEQQQAVSKKGAEQRRNLIEKQIEAKLPEISENAKLSKLLEKAKRLREVNIELIQLFDSIVKQQDIMTEEEMAEMDPEDKKVYEDNIKYLETIKLNFNKADKELKHQLGAINEKYKKVWATVNSSIQENWQALEPSKKEELTQEEFTKTFGKLFMKQSSNIRDIRNQQKHELTKYITDQSNITASLKLEAFQGDLQNDVMALDKIVEYEKGQLIKQTDTAQSIVTRAKDYIGTQGEGGSGLYGEDDPGSRESMNPENRNSVEPSGLSDHSQEIHHREEKKDIEESIKEVNTLIDQATTLVNEVKPKLDLIVGTLASQLEMRLQAIEENSAEESEEQTEQLDQLEKETTQMQMQAINNYRHQQKWFLSALKNSSQTLLLKFER